MGGPRHPPRRLINVSAGVVLVQIEGRGEGRVKGKGIAMFFWFVVVGE